ncbi:imelysin family protein [Jannaschia sp. AI_61]|nr:imelysin family protein [Jannaschia sp. AI_61]
MADIDAAVDDHILPRLADLSQATTALATAAETGCDALQDPFREAAEAWASAAHLMFGPGEDGGRASAIQFWPDARNATGRGLRLLAQQGAEAWTPEALARASVAARGLGALERAIFDGAAPCPLTQALTADLAATAAAIEAGRRDGFAATLRTASAEGNTRFLAPEEAEAALFTTLMTGLEFTATQRLGRPMGTFAEPRPLRAEMRRSGRSLANVTAALTALRDLAATLAEAPQTDAAFARAISLAEGLDDPVFAGVETTGGRLRVEALQTAVNETGRTANAEIGAALGVQAGFNRLDGD